MRKEDLNRQQHEIEKKNQELIDELEVKIKSKQSLLQLSKTTLEKACRQGRQGWHIRTISQG